MMQCTGRCAINSTTGRKYTHQMDSLPGSNTRLGMTSIAVVISNNALEDFWCLLYCDISVTVTRHLQDVATEQSTSVYPLAPQHTLVEDETSLNSHPWAGVKMAVSTYCSLSGTF